MGSKGRRPGPQGGRRVINDLNNTGNKRVDNENNNRSVGMCNEGYEQVRVKGNRLATPTTFNADVTCCTSGGENGSSFKSLSLTLSSDSSLPSNEARLSPASLKGLGAVSGTVLFIHAGRSVGVFVEVFLSAVCSSQCIVVANEVAATFSEKCVAVSVARNVCPLKPLSSVNLEITRDSRVGVGANSLTEPVDIPFLQVCSTFRRQYQRRLIFRGMRAVVHVGTVPFYIDVMQCVCSFQNEGCGESESDFRDVDLGILVDGASIKHVGCSSACDASSCSTEVVAGAPDTGQNHLVVLGDPGTGKSYYLRKEANNASALHSRHVELVAVEALSQGDLCDVSSSTVLREIFGRAKTSVPSTVIIDDLHLVCGTGDGAATDSAWAKGLLTSTLASELDDIRTRQLDVRVIVSSTSVELLPRSLLTYDRLRDQVKLLAPKSAGERLEFLKARLHIIGERAKVTDASVLHAAEATNGFTQRDLVRLLDVATIEAFKETGRTDVTDESLVAAMKIVPPSALKQFHVSVPCVTWNDIGGSEIAKKTLQDCVAWCLGKQQWTFRRFNLSPPRGVLLYGPPGCSKTMLAKALANESKMNFVSVKGPEVFSKWVGDSEKAVRDIFARARSAAPCVVFIDELDGMCGHRGRGGVADRVISQFLTELDGLPAALNDGADALVFVAATNRPDNIDPAVLRPGRIDRKVFVGLPDFSERSAIASIHIRNIPVAPELNADYIAACTEGYTGAEVVAVVKEAAFQCVTADVRVPYISLQNVEAALRNVRPRISPADVEWYKHWAAGQSASIF